MHFLTKILLADKTPEHIIALKRYHIERIYNFDHYYAENSQYRLFFSENKRVTVIGFG